ncbi:MAG: DNA alkylation repair protein [Bdellovibrionales bacterium]|nr:DNA alkylation repair protein [Bdellovibrionales bacterium]
MRLSALRQELENLQDPDRAEALASFHASAAGAGAGAPPLRFLGADVAQVRRLARAHVGDLKPESLRQLLSSPTLEERLLAAFVLVKRFQGGDAAEREAVFQEVLALRARLNHWDLVDLCGEHVLGAWLWAPDAPPLPRGPAKLLLELASGPTAWERRLALVAAIPRARTRPDDCFEAAALLCPDPGEPVQQALSWLLREVSKRLPDAADRFLQVHYLELPKQTLRAAIEKLPDDRRAFYLRARML